ncbi:unnamed protein product [Protopolystoma xenopodis]|uniref:Uncharacterized protein n=1 Tax=Protopolystoma xenopodis TaxID=117903 RepID=A0A448WD37_9PLAT|nr:unnamed protein product [Protopolystoma xenopodis]
MVVQANFLGSDTSGAARTIWWTGRKGVIFVSDQAYVLSVLEASWPHARRFGLGAEVALRRIEADLLGSVETADRQFATPVVNFSALESKYDNWPTRKVASTGQVACAHVSM